MSGWLNQADLFASVWTLSFCVIVGALLAAEALLPRWRPSREHGALAPPVANQSWRTYGRTAAVWAGLLLLICVLELLTHSGENNAFVKTSRPDQGIERWTTADGYATLMDGIPAQGDGLPLLQLLRLFKGEGPVDPSEFDRRAGHLYLVSFLTASFGTYWSFAVVNLLAWWLSSLCVWWLGFQRWPGTAVPWVGSLLVATGQGFIFMGAAPQAHAAAFAGFVLLLVLCERLGLWRPNAGFRSGASAGWAAGAAGLVYFTYIPALLFVWAYGVRFHRWKALLAVSAVSLLLVLSWERYGAVLGLTFSGGNNDLAGQALGGWWRLVRAGPAAVLDHLHEFSLRGLIVGAFYYPWLALALLGFWRSGPDARRWSLAILLAGAIPLIAFSTRFGLPRVAYFTFPAVYLLTARGIMCVADEWLRLSGHRRARLAAMGLLTAGLVVLANLDLLGVNQLNLWFHLSQGNQW